MNENFAAQIAARLAEALADFRETGSEIEDGMAHGYSLAQDQRTAEDLVALASGAQQTHREMCSNFSLGVALAVTRAVEILDETSEEAR